MKVTDDVFIDASSTDPTVTNYTRYINHAPSDAFSRLWSTGGNADAAAESSNQASSNIGAFGSIVGSDDAEYDDGASDGHAIPSMSGTDSSITCDDSSGASELDATTCEGESRQQKQQEEMRSQRRPRLVLFALRRIHAGSELLLDYGSEYWRGRPSPLAAESHKW